MTITERNQKLYDLRKKLDQKRLELAWIETEIMAVNSEYDRQNVDLYEQMFGTKENNWWDFSLWRCLLSLEQILVLSC